MADVLMSKTETLATAHEEVSKFAQEFLIQQAKFAPLVTNYSGLAVKGANSIKLPLMDGFTVGDKSENVAVDAQAITATADVITLDQHRVIQFLLEDIGDWQSNLSVVKESLMRATKAMALDMDDKIIAELRLADGGNEIAFTDATNEDLELGDILNARKLLVDQHLDPRECYMGVGSDQERNLLSISDFIDASKYGSNEPIMNGEIGKIYGMRVIVHTSLTNEALFWHPSAAGYAIQSGTRFQSDKDLANLATRYSLDYLAGFKVLDSGKRNVHITETA